MQQNMQQMQALQQQQQQLQHVRNQNYVAPSVAGNQPNAMQAVFNAAGASMVDNAPATEAYAVGMNMAATALALLANVANDNKEEDVGSILQDGSSVNGPPPPSLA